MVRDSGFDGSGLVTIGTDISGTSSMCWSFGSACDLAG